jgi:hypothetical protein
MNPYSHELSQEAIGRLRALRRKRALRWYRVRLWGIGPTIAAASAVALTIFHVEPVRWMLCLVFATAISATWLSINSAWFYFRWPAPVSNLIPLCFASLALLTGPLVIWLLHD